MRIVQLVCALGRRDRVVRRIVDFAALHGPTGDEFGRLDPIPRMRPLLALLGRLGNVAALPGATAGRRIVVRMHKAAVRPVPADPSLKIPTNGRRL